MSAEMDLEAWLVEQDTVGAEGVDSSGCRANVCGITVASVGICFFFFKGYGDHRDLPSSPTRRSSDLPAGRACHHQLVRQLEQGECRLDLVITRRRFACENAQQEIELGVRRHADRVGHGLASPS